MVNYQATCKMETPTNLPQLKATSSLFGPPSYEEVKKLVESTKPAEFDEIKLTESEIRNIFRPYAARKAGIPFSSVDHMVYTNITSDNCYVYKINSLVEERTVVDKERPYRNGALVDGPVKGEQVDLWAVKVPHPSKFVSGKSPAVPIEHTEVLCQCSKCKGSGMMTCLSCGGLGMTMTYMKLGNYSHLQTSPCLVCSGSGKRVCVSCQGSGQVVEYQAVVATWKSTTNQLVTSPVPELTEKFINSNIGIPLFNVTGESIEPLAAGDICNEAIVRFSQEKLQQIEKDNYDARILKLNHTIAAVPVTIVDFTLKDQPGQFVIYGTNYKVKINRYPSRSCCIC